MKLDGEFTTELLLNTMIQKSLKETMTHIVNGFMGVTSIGPLLFVMRRFRHQTRIAERS